MTASAVQFASGTPSISDFMDVENIFEQYFNDGASIQEQQESKGSLSAESTPQSDPPSGSLKTTDSSPPSVIRSPAVSPHVTGCMTYFDESQMEGLWDHFALDDNGSFRENTTQAGNGYMYPTSGGVSISAMTPSVAMATIQPNQVTHQPPSFFNAQKYHPTDKTIHSPLQTLVHGYHPSNTQAVHGQVTPVEDNQQTGIPVFPPDLFNHGSFAGRMDSPPQSRRGSISPQQQQNNRRSRKNSKASRELDEQSAQEAKRRRFLERNRVAASKCRQKKKEWMQNLEETARTAQNNSKYLQAAVTSLKDELLLLKAELLKHHGCECAKIRAYLCQEADRVVIDQQKKGNASILDMPTPVKSRQLSIAESEASEFSDMNGLGEDIKDILADESMEGMVATEV